MLSIGLPLLGCSEADDGVTYQDDIQPLFADRCTICHNATANRIVNIQQPFAIDDGLVGSLNPWLEGHPDGGTPEFNVLPGDPDNSFLTWKIEDPAAPALDSSVAGAPMPLQLPHLTPAEIATLETWVRDGAQDDAFFASEVVPIFGVEGQAHLGLGGTGRCIQCHYEGSPNPPDLSNPFGPNGLVNVRARLSPDFMRVVPNEVEESLMILKVRATEANALIGAPMPYAFDPLSPSQVAEVRQWIVEGARP